MDSAIKGNVNGITWNNKERNGLGKINNLRTRIELLLVKTRSLKFRIWSFRIKTRSSRGRWDKNFKQVRDKESQKNILARLDPSKVRTDPCLFVTASSRFSKHVYVDSCIKTRFLPCKDRSLWTKMHYKLKVTIFL